MLHTITSCSVLMPLAVRVEWCDGVRNDFHYLMLRDNCFYAQCYDCAVGERIKLTSSIDPNTTIRLAKVTDDKVVVYWEDGHVSKYDSEWLRRNALAFVSKGPDFIPQSWDGSFVHNLPKFLYGELIADEQALAAFLLVFRNYGISIIEGVPLEKNETEKFANHLAYVREIVFDRVADIKISADAYTQGFTNVAYAPTY